VKHPEPDESSSHHQMLLFLWSA